jgi:hypothetical protein
MSNFQSIADHIYRRVVVVQLQRLGENWRARPPVIEAPHDSDPVAVEQAPPATTSPKKASISWSYMRGLYMVSTFRHAIVINRACRGRPCAGRTLPG